MRSPGTGARPEAPGTGASEKQTGEGRAGGLAPAGPIAADPETDRARRTIDVLLCTHRRAHVARTIASINAQNLPEGVSLRIIVADNDHTPSAAGLVKSAGENGWPILYLHAPADNISVARNACLDAASADFVAFIDDDEVATPEWIAGLVAQIDATGADAVFGPAVAVYPADAPAWMRTQDHHSNRPVRRHGRVATGHTCNALLRFGTAPWASERFDLDRGRSGGEDTAYFFRLSHLGARYDIVEGSYVFEAVEPDRLDIAWIKRRKFRMGQSYASSATGRSERTALFLAASLKAIYCRSRARIAREEGERIFWRLRCVMHEGVRSACRGQPALEIYGNAS